MEARGLVLRWAQRQRPHGHHAEACHSVRSLPGDWALVGRPTNARLRRATTQLRTADLGPPGRRAKRRRTSALLYGRPPPQSPQFRTAGDGKTNALLLLSMIPAWAAIRATFRSDVDLDHCGSKTKVSCLLLSSSAVVVSPGSAGATPFGVRSSGWWQARARPLAQSPRWHSSANGRAPAD